MPGDEIPSARQEPDDRHVGVALKAMRKALGLTGQQLGERAGMSQAKISRIETGSTAADVKDVETLARALEAPPDEVRRLVDLAAHSQNQLTEWHLGHSGVAARQREFADLEIETRELRVFQPAVIIGLLQTSEYARAIITSFQNQVALSPEGAPSGVVSEAVSARVRRHEVLAEPRKQFHFVMSEAVLSNRLSRPADMVAQIERLREVARQDNVDLRIIPADARLAVPPYHGFELMDDRCVVVDLYNTPIMSKVRSDIQLYRHIFDLLRESATPQIEDVLDRYLDLYLNRTRSRDQPRSG